MDKIRETYICNCLNSISINTAKMGGGKKVEKSYSEIIKKIDEVQLYSKNKKEEKEDNVDSIIACTIAKCGFKLKKREGEKQNGFI